MGKRYFAPIAILIVFVAHAFGQSPATDIGDGDRAAIQAVIQGQIAAFQQDDGPAAFSFASPSIKHLFMTPENFMDMVRTGYPQVYRPSSVRFGKLVRIEDALVQLVDMVGPDGLPVVAAYEMQRQPDGSWRINGCRLLRSPGRST